ncbi:MAG TPA: bifunctional pyr operon transcriptional regulator/uracil phosphoribosyltransferase PyrR [Opitutae bacterium]|nr:bifunctional pyr operon transcriptional regulator/uracil phosphoribosyltransferase PyrR [Opitutae bacterium]
MSIRKSISSQDINAAIEKIAADIAINHSDTKTLVLAAIANGGIAVNELLQSQLLTTHNLKSHSATIDISFHRDDIGVNPISKEVESTSLVQNPEESTIILVDDVIFSGRSVRAALSEVHALGRPRKVELAVLVDRGNRRLPIEPNYRGISEITTIDEKVEAHLFPKNPEKSHIDILSP